MALSRVELTGDICNVGTAWRFGEAAKVVYGMDWDPSSLVRLVYRQADEDVPP